VTRKHLVGLKADGDRRDTWEKQTSRERGKTGRRPRA